MAMDTRDTDDQAYLHRWQSRAPAPREFCPGHKKSTWAEPRCHSCGGPPATTKKAQVIELINIQYTFIYFRLTKRLTKATGMLPGPPTGHLLGSPSR